MKSRTHARATALLFAASLLAAAACRAFEPTISRRQGNAGLVSERLPLSLGEEFPELLQPAPLSSNPQRHTQSLGEEYVWPSVAGDERIEIEFRDAPLAQVLLFLSQHTGLNMQLDPDVDLFVDVSFPDVTIDTALRALLGAHELQLVENPPGIYQVVRGGGSQVVSATFHLQSVSAESVGTNLQALVAPETRLVIDSAQGLVMVRGVRSDAQAIAEYLDAVDRLQRQVLIEARILEITLSEGFELGVSGVLDDVDIDGSTLDLLQNLSTPDDSFALTWTNSAGSVEATINAISRYVGTDLISSPRVLALSGTPATISVVREVPYVNVTSTTSGTTGGVGSQTIEEVQFKEAGVKLMVTPTIQEGGTIHVHIEQELSEVVDLFNEIPVLDTRSLNTDFLVLDRQTVVLGGLMQDARRETDEGVPGLKDIPILGRLFRSDEDELRKRELVLFLTPRIVDADEAARLVSAMRQRYPERLRETGVKPVAEPGAASQSEANGEQDPGPR